MFRQSTLQQCDEEIMQKGHTVFYIPSWRKKDIENWVQEVAKRSGQKVDWHYSGGNANIIGLGDLDKIRNTIKEMLPELNKSINEYKKNKWGGLLNETHFTEQHVDYWKDREVFRSTFLKN